MFKNIGLGLFLLFIAPSAIAEEVKSLNDKVFAVPRQFGTEITPPLDVQTRLIGAKQNAIGDFAFGPPTSEDLRTISSSYQPRTLVSGLPLIQTKGIVKGRNALFIADTGKDGTHKEPARIWRLDPTSGELTKFYEGPVLVNAKWIFFVAGVKPNDDQLIVSDYGEEPVPRAPGNGVGAKLFSIPIQSDGSSGTPRIIHSGAPFRSPEGVTVIGDTVILADWAAGSKATRPEVPNSEFLSGAVFAVPLSGGDPVNLFPDQIFVTSIGVCIYYEGNDLYLRVIDIEGGRIDKSGGGTYPHSGIAQFYRAKVISASPLKLGPLEVVPLTEDIPVSLQINNFESGKKVVVETLDGANFPDGQNARIFGSKSIASDGRISFVVRSLLTSSAVSLKVGVIFPDRKRMPPEVLNLDKSDDSVVSIQDNKHAGSKAKSKDIGRSGEPVLSASADGTSRSLVLIPVRGGTPAVLWRGAPFSSPMGVQFSWDEKKLWITDQAAGANGTSAVFEVDVPDVPELAEMFPNAFKWP